ncbi:hypothetical protein CBF45_15615 [Bordetella sp. J329]|jgi:predicted transposase/invertase (TIGR01784 family)|uniref:Rpn family recombination-promoting nuclease/putative transposase n=1 Tax=Kerstersia gyiorum TaxID=206506 RepID=UPI000FDB50B1|nr:Rpn family recombination-promoting nuclease/putative transposase [Kerstersia gyiorum]AZV94963.1 hypothetical protein CBF45_15615 [Bordetella sp. J329]MCH4270567.1 Rpn family recombination-promoting nuclease/putative transposase [Kerstersia gyiorum]MCI1228164.1 Rpn family recombination-promoting nuclease/putative transposase [Kerstersia gyiorum]
MTTPRSDTGTQASPPSPRHRTLTLSNDLVFKTLFSRQLHLLTDLINAVRYREPPIEVVQIRNPNILPTDVSSKQIILDILAQNTHGSLFNVEMQLRQYPQWPLRNMFYLARMLSDQLSAGQQYQSLKPAISIGLLAHDLYPAYPGQADWHFTLRDALRPAVQLGQAMQVHIIELTKAETLHAFPPALTDWVACLHHNLGENPMNRIEHAPVREALQHLEDMYADRDFRLLALRREMAIADEQLALDYAKQKGHEEGLAAGQAALLAQLLSLRFGELPPATHDKLQHADGTSLSLWAQRLLQAPTLEAVFH